MRMKSDQDRDNEAKFNNPAHERVRAVLNIAEDYLIREGVCDPYDAEDVLCWRYIETVAGVINGASYFLQGEATAGAEIFLIEYLDTCPDERPLTLKRLTAAKMLECSNQLSFHTLTYFRNFNEILTRRLTEELHRPDDGALIGASWNGIFHFAAAKLPGVQEQINRELRRRGLDYDAAIVPTKHLERQMRALGSHRRQIGGA